MLIEIGEGSVLDEPLNPDGFERLRLIASAVLAGRVEERVRPRRWRVRVFDEEGQTLAESVRTEGLLGIVYPGRPERVIKSEPYPVV